jgi:hypothetical protein
MSIPETDTLQNQEDGKSDRRRVHFVGADVPAPAPRWGEFGVLLALPFKGRVGEGMGKIPHFPTPSPSWPPP